MVVVTLFILFAVLPALLGFVEHVRGSLEKRALYYRHVQTLESWGATQYSLAAFMGCTTLLYVAGFLAKAGIRLGGVTYLLLLFLSSMTALVYLCYYWGIPGFFKKHAGIIKVLVGAVAIGVATLSKIYSDAAIAELTGLPPQNFPDAQLLLTFILTPTLWFLGLSLLAGFLSLPVMVVLFLRAVFLDFLSATDAENKGANMPAMAALLAVALFVLISLTVTQGIASKSFYEIRLKQAIAFSSFHLSATYCGFPESEKGRVATLSDDRAAIAIADEKAGYVFKLISCKPKIKGREGTGVMTE